ncbi:hypothetical protein [Psychrobacillus psychrodurans]|uniref:Uncharacterized protein n=1 Tax=Psychrobacillus psychrodurans TaxID=126157 RepID=A0A9X3R9Y2_9BACI|nr:hypothetical protein [Psychrobacillus psychrodurans]MCZ8532593.1 hypothetical protein [Psychrobacillus psychrodurans]
MKKMIFMFIILFLVACSNNEGEINQTPKMDIAEALALSEKKFKEEGIESVSAFNGETIKFRLLLDEQPTEKEATKLFVEMLDTVASYTSQSEDMWDFYKVKFDLSYKDVLIFEGRKEKGEDLIVKPI